MKIPLSAPDITEQEIEAVAAVLRTSQLSIGPKMVEFEAAVANYAGMPHAVAVSSGTAGLHLCICALGLREGDEVIVPSFTFIAAANAVRYERATPVFVDIDPASLNMSPSDIERAITPRTRAIIVVHTFGRPADMRPIQQLAQQHQLALIEDACEAIGAEFEGRRVGAFGDAAVFAFYPNKQITTGEGGIIVTPRPDLAARVRALRNQGRGLSGDWFQHLELGYNYRLSEINCTLGIGQMRRLDGILARREQVARRYNALLAGTASLILPQIDIPGVRMSWFVYVVRLSAAYSSCDRDAIAQMLHNAGIGCGRYFAPIHLQPAYSDWKSRRPLPVTESESQRTLALPFFNRMTDAQIAEVCSTLIAAIQHRSPAKP
jgi:perosamine synthetase